MEEAVRTMANRKAVGPDGLPLELLKVLVDDGDSDNFGNFYETIVALWRRERVLSNGRMPPLECYTRRKMERSVVTILASPLWRTLAKYSAKSSRPPQ